MNPTIIGAKLEHRLEHLEMFQSFVGYEWRKPAQTLDFNTGSRPLFTGLAVQPILHSPTLFYSTYADIKKLAWNKSLKDSSIIPRKLETN